MKKIGLILISLFTAFIVSEFLKKNIFIANTPLVNKNFLAKIKQNFKTSFDLKKANSYFLTKKQQKEFADLIQNTAFQPITRGVKAGETQSGIKVYQYKLDEIEWQEINYTIQNKTITIKIPKGTTPPSAEIVEKISK